MDRLRTRLAQLLTTSRLGPGRQWAKWGRMLAAGKRLPAIAKEMKPGRLLSAYQADLFNAMVAWRPRRRWLGRAAYW